MSREEIVAANPIVDFVRSRGHELRSAGKNFVTNGCPVTVHKKTWHRPVSIDVKKRCWFCNDCKVGGTVIDWVMRERGCNAEQAMRELGGGRNNQEERGQVVCAYNYTDEGGNLIFQCVRSKPKAFWQRRPDGKGGWINSLQGVRRVLYRLPEVKSAQTVCVVEGEKDADNLAKLGFVATTNPMGAGKWRDEYSETLRGKDVAVFGDVGDADKSGEKHTERVIESLGGKAKSIKHIVLPDGFHDVSDYIASLPHETARDTIGKLIDQTPTIELQSREALELPSSPPPYVPPPLDLLPSVLQDYIHAAAGSLNVDVAYPFLPLLSSLGAAIGNSRSIILKRGFIQPPVIWTGVIGPTGSLKSPGLEAGYSPILEHERELKRQNQQAQELFEEDHAGWKSENPKKRGPEPEKPVIVTCLMDDLTIEVLSERLAGNPRGVLVAKDEISHWFASFDQYKSVKGSDVSRWLSLHTAVFLAVDRVKDNRHHRIWMPRVCITGGIQPKILRRVLNEEFFERGLPARFLLAYPTPTQPRWSEATVPEKLQKAVMDLFEELWQLQPKRDEAGQVRPKLLPLDDEAKAIFVRFYNECGAVSVEADEHGAAAWCKLAGHAARLVLVGQLARDPSAEFVTGDTMRAACDLARWLGNEAVRIYAELAETGEQREQRELVEFIKQRGSSVTLREVTHCYWPLKGQTDKALEMFTALEKWGRGKWEETRPSGPGRPTRIFRLDSASPKIGNSPSIVGNYGDGDAESSQKITSSREPDTETETLVGDESGVARL